MDRLPGSASQPRERSTDRQADLPDEASVARWAAWYEGLPEGLREALDTFGKSSAKTTPER